MSFLSATLGGILPGGGGNTTANSTANNTTGSSATTSSTTTTRGFKSQHLVGGGKTKALSPEDLVLATIASASLLATASRAARASEVSVPLFTDDDDDDADADTAKEGRGGPKKSVSEAMAESKVDIERRLNEIKTVLIGDADQDVDETKALRVARAAVDRGLARALAACVIDLPLEARKAAAHVVANLARRPDDVGDAFAERLVGDGYTLDALTRAYPETAEVSLACGTMLRETSRHRIVARAALKLPTFWLVLTDYVHIKNFDVAADAFSLLRCLLTEHPSVSSAFVRDNYDFFFECYHRLLRSDNYVTCRESLRLLSDLLLDRAHYQTMIKYIAKKEHLKILMLLMRSKKARIQLEAFHVFKIFVANPKKADEIVKVLVQNKSKLITYLSDFHSNDHSHNDAQFLEERHLVLDTLRNLPDYAAADPEQKSLDAARDRQRNVPRGERGENANT